MTCLRCPTNRGAAGQPRRPRNADAPRRPRRSRRSPPHDPDPANPRPHGALTQQLAAFPQRPDSGRPRPSPPQVLPLRCAGRMLAVSRSAVLRGRRKPRRASPRLRQERLGREPGLTHLSAPARPIRPMARCGRLAAPRSARDRRWLPLHAMRQREHQRTREQALPSISIDMRTRVRKVDAAGRGSPHGHARRSWRLGTR